MRDRNFWMVVATGLLMGGLGVLLSVWGNPENSGICVSCFIENSAGALGFHDNQRMQYLRPELTGFVLGSFLSALSFREFRSRGGSSPILRLSSGIFLMVGCAVFVGCPIKLMLRLTAGDLTALAGVAGLILGVWIGLHGLKNGVQLGKSSSERGGSGLLVPAAFLLLGAFIVRKPDFIAYSTLGGAARYAPWMIALASGLALGVVAQRSRFCITGSVRDTLLMGGRTPLIWGMFAFLIAATCFNLATGRFRLGLYGQPGAHLDHLWTFLGMGLVGWISVIIGGCPFRQLIKAGEGDTDAGLAVMGMFIGGALVQSWGIAATTAGVPHNGKAAVLVGLAFAIICSILYRERTE